VQARRLFGGHGLYLGGLMFGLLDDDELFLKTDAETRPRFVAAGGRMWLYPGAEETDYLRPPDEAHEDAEAMLAWAELGLAAARRKQAEKDARARAKAERRAAREAAAAGAPSASKAPGRKAPAKKASAGRAPGKKAAARKAAAGRTRPVKASAGPPRKRAGASRKQAARGRA
jgi:DNA transformation protein